MQFKSHVSTDGAPLRKKKESKSKKIKEGLYVTVRFPGKKANQTIILLDNS